MLKFKPWPLKLLIIINREGVASQERMDRLIQKGSSHLEFEGEGRKIMAFSKCFSRLYRKYDRDLENQRKENRNANRF